MQRLPRTLRRACLSTVFLATLATALPSHANQSDPSALAILEAMVASGVLSQEQADAILVDARARDAARAAESAPPPLPEGAKRVVYVPEIVKQELREEIKEEVLAEAERENWAAPNTHPEWSERITISGDIRARYEVIDLDDGNVVLDALGNPVPLFPDFNAINQSSSGVRVFGTGAGNDDFLLDAFAPERNVNQDRHRARIRARLGLDARLPEGFSTGLRLATGSSNAPVSTNQSLGSSGGNFSNYEIWLDRAFIRWDAFDEEAFDREDIALSLTVGRFENPFFATDLIWDSDLNFDGAAISASYEVAEGFRPFLTLGAFPIFNGNFNFSSADAVKTASNNKYLYGIQGGADWSPMEDLGIKFGAAFYYFDNVEGRLSSPCPEFGSSGGSCDTDELRPSFAQTGNTYMALRDVSPVTDLGNPAFQFFGLASDFQELALTTRVDYDGFDPLSVSFTGEFVANLAFDESENAEEAVNNFGPSINGAEPEYEGGNIGYQLGITVGSQEFAERWDWTANFTYKYLETDAVVDAFTDSDFGLGGTNLEGFIVGGGVVLAPNVWADARWISADNINGNNFSADTFQANLSARF
ncbi:putative porin [Algihabitans albus]|uniref:putative porin n=1 Tax=Algihabitans albus TaxID=2164067 RepID=UPI0035D12F54